MISILSKNIIFSQNMYKYYFTPEGPFVHDLDGMSYETIEEV